MATDPSIRDTIARVAREEGIDPAYALAVAERESSFNPNAGGVGTIRGLYQFTGANHRKYGVADNANVEDQTRAFARFSRDLRQEMTQTLGRVPTDAELYSGHHMGGARAARILSGQHADLAPSDIFSPREMAGNPHFGRARTAGDLTKSITADIDRRMAKHGGAAVAQAPGSVDFAAFGAADGAQPAPSMMPGASAQASRLPNPSSGAKQITDGSPDNSGKILPPGSRPAAGAVDFAQFGQAQPEAPTSTKTAKVDLKVNNQGAQPAGVVDAAFGQPGAPAMSSFAPTESAENIDTRPGTEVDLAQLDAPVPPVPIAPENPYYPDVARGVF